MIEFEPDHPSHELVLSARYDSKTELLEHEHRRFFTQRLGAGIVLTLLLGVAGLLERWLWVRDSGVGKGGARCGPHPDSAHAVLACGLGLNLSMGRLLRRARAPSTMGLPVRFCSGWSGVWREGSWNWNRQSRP